MASQVGICNIVATRIAADRIVSINEGTEIANALKAVYDHCLDLTIAEGSWPETYYTRVLAPLDETPVNGYSYAYLLPESPKFLGALEILESTSTYLSESGKIYSDDSTLTIRYKARIDTEEAGTFLQRALIAKLVHTLSKYAGTDLLQLAAQEYREAIIQGRKVTDKQRTPKNKSSFSKSNILKVR